MKETCPSFIFLLNSPDFVDRTSVTLRRRRDGELPGAVDTVWLHSLRIKTEVTDEDGTESVLTCFLIFLPTSIPSRIDSCFLLQIRKYCYKCLEKTRKLCRLKDVMVNARGLSEDGERLSELFGD